MTELTDPLGDFFRELHHRLDLYPTLTPVGQAWPTIATYDLYGVWLRDRQQRREAQLKDSATAAPDGGGKDDDFAFPNVPVELRQLFIAVSNVVMDEMRQPGHRASLIECSIQNRIRHAFEEWPR
jgi:hypothetical protein